MYYREDTHPPWPGWGSWSWGSFGSLKGRPKGNACLIVFACVRHAYKGDTWSLWTCIWLPFAICLLMQIYFPNISLVRVDPRSTRYRQRSRS